MGRQAGMQDPTGTAGKNGASQGLPAGNGGRVGSGNKSRLPPPQPAPALAAPTHSSAPAAAPLRGAALLLGPKPWPQGSAAISPRTDRHRLSAARTHKCHLSSPACPGGCRPAADSGDGDGGLLGVHSPTKPHHRVTPKGLGSGWKNPAVLLQSLACSQWVHYGDGDGVSPPRKVFWGWSVPIPRSAPPSTPSCPSSGSGLW